MPTRDDSQPSYLDLGDGGPLIPCRDRAHAERLAQLWLVLRDAAPEYDVRARIERLAAVGRGMA